MEVEFRLLGELELLVDGHPVRIGHTRERAVLLALLADLNRPVPLDELADRIWGERLPRRPRDALYGHLSRLRSALADLDTVTVRKQPGGYALTADPATVDLHRFSDGVTRARASTDDRRALELFDQALALWRGQPLAEGDTPWLVALRDTLNRRRREAELDRNDVRLRLGQHAELLTDLSARAEESRLDERLAGQLILALYRSGRQAEALTHYEQIRTRLAEELGTDPSPPLRRLHERILTADPAIETPASLPGRVVPRQLPAMPPSFTGRTAELAALDSTTPISVVSGGGGIGKTWLALRWAHDHADEFPDGQLYVNLRGFDPVERPLSPSAAIRGFLDALGVPPAGIPADLDAQAGLYRSLMADRRLLVVLDNARDTAQVTPLLPGGGTVLITSRHRLGGLLTTHGARPLPLDVLDNIQARNLLIRHLGASRVAAEPEAVGEISRHCAGLPLALGIIAARAAAHPEFPLTALATELRDTRLDALDAGELPADLRAVFAASVHALAHETATAFGLLALAPGTDIGLPATAALLDLPLPRTRTVLRELESAHLVRQYVPGRYRMHDLVRLYATELPTTADKTVALTRLFDYYRYAASVAADHLSPHEPYRRPPIPEPTGPPIEFADFRDARAWLDTERSTLLAVAAHAAAHGWRRHAWHLSITLFRYLDWNAHYHDALTLHTIALDAARGTEGEGHALGCRGFTLVRLGRYAEALADSHKALALFRGTGGLAGETSVSASLGIIHDQLGQYDQAIKHYEHALATARRAGHRSHEGTALNNLGDLHRKLGHYEMAAEHLHAGLAIVRELQNWSLGAIILTSLGALHQETGRFAEARKCFQHALPDARDGSHSLEVEVLNQLGELALVTDDPDEARKHYRQAETLSCEIGYRQAQAIACHGLARAHRELGEPAEARRHAEAALGLYTALGLPEADAVRAFLTDDRSGSSRTPP
ncbi:AfsR/SARP family transcriptional regulator [Amycolatopsis anabasis]|uniref:AfsR/SARP family transcriptional regulator n=1 Tax=Amycolatopsis anabasis TaxID=1840409 RepID=UPI00131B7307|nr:tetratricopeptide repeat protein [Amycolatopsis anabasis]